MCGSSKTGRRWTAGRRRPRVGEELLRSRRLAEVLAAADAGAAVSDAAVVYRHRIPRPPLDCFVASIWVYRDEGRPCALERILPTGAAQLIVNLKEDQTRLYDPEPPYRCVSTSGSVLSGMQTRFQVIDTSEQEYVAGVSFKPGGTVPLFRVPAHEASDA